MKNISLLSTIIISFLLPTKAIFAQVVHDNTLGTQVTPSVNQFIIAGGRKVQNNLFHSFQQFSIPTNGSATFNIDANIQNIFSRVTGHNISNIDGTIKYNIPSQANLFLINPNGIIFGTGARLDSPTAINPNGTMKGSFVATTANAIAFGNKGNFGINTSSEQTSLLTVNPSALLYNQINAQASITHHGNFTVSTGKNVLLAGGDVTMDAGRITAPGGRVELTGLKQNGQIGLNINENNNPELILDNNLSLANVKFDNAADINLRSAGGGNLFINANTFDLLGNSRLRSGIANTSTSLNNVAGDVTINTRGDVTIDGSGSFIINDVRPGGIGQAGNININTNSLIMKNGGEILDQLYGQGQAGAIIINAKDQVNINGSNATVLTGILNTIESTGNGTVKGITINTNSLILNNWAQIQTLTRGGGKGDAGPITITATGSITGDGTNNSPFPATGIFSVIQTGAIGNGGEVKVTGRSLSLINGANISTTAFDPVGTGTAGNITLDIKDQIYLSGSDNSPDKINSGIFAATFGQGQGGTITVNTGDLILNDGAAISSKSFKNDPSAGAGGNLQIKSNNIFLNNQSKLFTETAFSTGGSIMIDNNNLLILRNNSLINTSAGGGNGNGGNIIINTPFLVAVSSENSDIIANALKGQGGNISLTSFGIYGLAPRAKQSPATSDITASSEVGLNGTIVISTPGVDPAKGLSQLPSTPVDLSGLVSSGCGGTTQAKNNSFIVTGRGGLPIDPFNVLDIENYQFDLGVASPTIANHSYPITTKILPNNNWPLLEAQGWTTNLKGQITLTNYNPRFNPQYVPIPVISCRQN